MQKLIIECCVEGERRITPQLVWMKYNNSWEINQFGGSSVPGSPFWDILDSCKMDDLSISNTVEFQSIHFSYTCNISDSSGECYCYWLSI